MRRRLLHPLPPPTGPRRWRKPTARGPSGYPGEGTRLAQSLLLSTWRSAVDHTGPRARHTWGPRPPWPSAAIPGWLSRPHHPAVRAPIGWQWHGRASGIGGSRPSGRGPRARPGTRNSRRSRAHRFPTPAGRPIRWSSASPLGEGRSRAPPEPTRRLERIAPAAAGSPGRPPGPWGCRRHSGQLRRRDGCARQLRLAAAHRRACIERESEGRRFPGAGVGGLSRSVVPYDSDRAARPA